MSDIVSVSISELYGKRIISNEGKMLGEIKGVMLNLEEGAVSHLRQDLLNDVTNQIFSHLHGRYRCKEGPVGWMVSCRSEW